MKKKSRSLLLITDGTDDHISAIDNSASRELQLSIINSKLPCKKLISSKMCVFASWPVWWEDKTEMCKCLSSVIIWFFFYFLFQYRSFLMPHEGYAWKIWMDCLELWVQITILWKWRYCPFSKVSSVCQCVPGDFYKKCTSELSENVIVFFTRDVVFHVHTFWRSPMKLKLQW